MEIFPDPAPGTPPGHREPDSPGPGASHSSRTWPHPLSAPAIRPPILAEAAKRDGGFLRDALIIIIRGAGWKTDPSFLLRTCPCRREAKAAYHRLAIDGYKLNRPGDEPVARKQMRLLDQNAAARWASLSSPPPGPEYRHAPGRRHVPAQWPEPRSSPEELCPQRPLRRRSG